MTDLEVAARGEEAACQYLEKQGWEVLARNWKRELGELDIVAVRDESWCGQITSVLNFVEVKTRAAPGEFPPEWRVGREKQRRVRRLAELFLAENEIDAVAQFDVVAVDIWGATPRIRHYEEAF